MAGPSSLEQNCAALGLDILQHHNREEVLCSSGDYKLVPNDLDPSLSITIICDGGHRVLVRFSRFFKIALPSCCQKPLTI